MRKRPSVENVRELLRLPAPAPQPQALAFDGTVLWVGSRETNQIFSINPTTWTAREEAVAPGKPYGMTVIGDELRVLCALPPDDDRVIYRFIPGHGFKTEGAIKAPDDAGSYLGYDGDRLYMSQWYTKRIYALDEQGAVGSIIEVPHEIAGQVIVDGRFYLVTTEDDGAAGFWLTRVDARGATPQCEDIARIPFSARSLAFDGERFWTNHRDANETVAFARPDA
jgi:outer membrane protein assembly factor BamB